MFEYFYNEILRRTIIGFGTLFNSISIKQDGSPLRVPLAYGPTQKFLARLTQSPDLNKATAITLPRMSFEFTGLTYDPSRKVTTTQQFTVRLYYGWKYGNICSTICNASSFNLHITASSNCMLYGTGI